MGLIGVNSKNVTLYGLGGVRKKCHVKRFGGEGEGGGSSLDTPQTVQRDTFSLTPSQTVFHPEMMSVLNKVDERAAETSHPEGLRGIRVCG